MRNNRYKVGLTFLWLLWTAGVLYGSLAPGDDLPSGWFAWIPHFDKGVHFGFYAGEMALLLLLFNPPTWRRGGVLLLVIAASALIEYLQGAYFGRSNDRWDLLANAVGALCGLLIAPLLQRWISRRQTRQAPRNTLPNVPSVRKKGQSV